jgi:nucleotide-binding universal stress UspA family protein
VRQSDVLLAPGGTLVLVAVVDPMQAIHVAVARSPVHAARHVLEDVEKLDRAAGNALEQARAEVTRATAMETVETGGPPVSCLLEEIASRQTSLVALGTHGLGRAAGILLGGVATRMLHRSPCSLLVARQPAAGQWSPRMIVVGVDGSASAEAALAACRDLESRFGAELQTVTVEGRRPGHGLVEATAGADLLAVGSRSAHHALGLGSVSEHVAHHAPCSVLVVRASPPAGDR